MNRFVHSSRVFSALALICCPSVQAADVDQDGIEDFVDICSNTPKGIAINSAGRPLADADEDCDVDLKEFALLQIAFHSLEDLSALVANMTGPLPCVRGVPKRDIELRVVVRSDASLGASSCALGESEGGVLMQSCFVLQVFALDTSETQRGLSCVFFDILLGNFSCPFRSTAMTIADTFSESQSGELVFSVGADELGGCTLEPNVGVGEWALVATLDVSAPTFGCSAGVGLSEAATESSLVAGGVTIDIGYGEPQGLTARCWGFIYDINASGHIDAADFSLFLGCQGQVAPYTPACEQMDWNCDGVIDSTDLSWFNTAWQEVHCGGGIRVPPCQLNCN
jgi:hypothetical protein